MTHNRQLALIRTLCGLGLPAQTLAPSLLPALRTLIPSHSAAIFWVDARFEMTSLYAERLLPPEAMARYYEDHYKDTANRLRTAYAARVRAHDPVSAHKVTKAEQTSTYFRDVLAQLDAYQILYGILRDGTRPLGQISFYRGVHDCEFGRRDQDVLRGLLRYLAIGLRPRPPQQRAIRQAEIVEEWLGLVETDGPIASAPADWSRAGASARDGRRGATHAARGAARGRRLPQAHRRVLRRAGARRPAAHRHPAGIAMGPLPPARLSAPGYRGPAAVAGRPADRPPGAAFACARPRHRGVDLSPQQREVAMLLAEGQSNQEIARSLDLTLNTANYHVKQVFTRLHVHSRDEVADVLLRLAHEGNIVRGVENVAGR